MKRIQMEQMASQRADEPGRGRPAIFLLAICLVLAVGTVISSALLGGSLSRFARRESNVISLVPQEAPLSAKDGSGDPTPPKPKAAAPAPRSSAPETAGQTASLRIHDAVQNWSSETQVDLFRSSYDGTVVSGDGEKVIAPGTSNFYTFTLENNGDLPLDYTISLKVENSGKTPESGPDIPLQWRLLDGNTTPLGDWRGYSETAEVMKQAKLDRRRQDSYTIEWRWSYERDAEGDRADTALGDLAAKQLLGTKATIIVHAEQDGTGPTRPSRPSGLHLLPQTGDGSNVTLYTVLMAGSGGGLLALFRRKRKKRE